MKITLKQLGQNGGMVIPDPKPQAVDSIKACLAGEVPHLQVGSIDNGTLVLIPAAVLRNCIIEIEYSEKP